MSYLKNNQNKQKNVRTASNTRQKFRTISQTYNRKKKLQSNYKIVKTVII